MKKEIWNSVFIFTIANGWELVAVVKSPGLAHIVTDRLLSFYGKRCAQYVPGKSAPTPTTDPREYADCFQPV